MMIQSVERDDVIVMNGGSLTRNKCSFAHVMVTAAEEGNPLGFIQRTSVSIRRI